MFDILWQHVLKRMQQLSPVGVHTNLFYWPSRVLWGFPRVTFFSIFCRLDEFQFMNLQDIVFFCFADWSLGWTFLMGKCVINRKGSCFSMTQVGSKPMMVLGAAVFWSPLAVWRMGGMMKVVGFFGWINPQLNKKWGRLKIEGLISLMFIYPFSALVRKWDSLKF